MYNIEFDIQKDYGYNKKGKQVPKIFLRLITKLGKAIDTDAIVDTGSEYSIFFADYLASLDLKLIDGEEVTLSSLKSSFTAYRHNLNIIVFKNCTFNLNVCFSENIPRNLLGRDFLNHIHFGLREHYNTMFFKFTP